MSDNKFDTWSRVMAQAAPFDVTDTDEMFSRTSIGTRKSPISEAFLGFNHRGLPSSIPMNRDYYGMVFFTKPDLNMQAVNLRNARAFTPLLTTEEMSTPRAIRCMLDARHTEHANEPFNCKLVDPKQAFIPLLTNLSISMGGWPDIELPSYNSDAGIYGEQIAFVDGIGSIYRTYDMTVNFRNILGDPISALFYYWVMYEQHVYEGLMVPHAENLSETAIDYTTRIYRLVLDPSMRYVQKIACTGASYPDRINVGASFSYESNAMFDSNNQQIGINFKCIGADYFDDIIIHDFNRTAMLSNPDLGDCRVSDTAYASDEYRAQTGMMKVPPEYLHLFNHNGYPLINIYTHELEWWVYKTEFTELTGELDGSQGMEATLDDITEEDLVSERINRGLF